MARSVLELEKKYDLTPWLRVEDGVVFLEYAYATDEQCVSCAFQYAIPSPKFCQNARHLEIDVWAD